MSLVWPFSSKEAVAHIEAAEGDRVLDDGTRIIARCWGSLWDATVLPVKGVGFSTRRLVRSEAKALDEAEAEYRRLIAEGWPSLEYYRRVRAAKAKARAERDVATVDTSWITYGRAGGSVWQLVGILSAVLAAAALIATVVTWLWWRVAGGA